MLPFLWSMFQEDAGSGGKTDDSESDKKDDKNDAAKTYTQEHLDALCEQARTSFDDPMFSLSVEAFGEPHAALVMALDGVQIFLRSESEPADALITVCDHSIDLAAIVTKLRETLETISAGS